MGALSTTELLSLSNTTTFKIGPDLPEKRFGHCVARINSTHVFLAGGSSLKTYIFDERSYNFTEMDQLTYQRSKPACAVVESSNTTTLMVVGGECPREKDFCPWSREVLSLDADGNPEPDWILHANKNLTGGWSHGGYVTDFEDTGLVLVGSKSYDSDVFPDSNVSEKIITLDEEIFKLLPGTLEYGRSGSTAITVPKGSISCE